MGFLGFARFLAFATRVITSFPVEMDAL